MLRKRALIYASDLKYGREDSVAAVQQRFFSKRLIREHLYTVYIETVKSSDF